MEPADKQALTVGQILDKCVPTDKMPWAAWDGPDSKRIGIKLLHSNPATGEYVSLCRYAKGMHVPRHKHLAPLHTYTLSGVWRYLEYDWLATPGCYVYEELGATHSLVIEEETTCFHVTEGPHVLYNDDGSLRMNVDWEFVQRYWRKALRDVGLDPSAWKES
jgi:quercetin dioxygenase-like cupin family protein